MKKLLIPVFAAILAAGGFLFNSFNNTGYDSGGIQRIAEIPGQIAKVEKEGLAPCKYINASVVKVVDGDTIDAYYRGKTYTVRLLDVDTPESVKHGVPVQAYAKEASGFMRKSALHEPIKLVFEKRLRDKYGRLLAHVILKNGTYLNAMLVRNGFARVEIIKPNNALAGYFYKLQEKAIEEKAGLWGLPPDKQPFIKKSDGIYIPEYRGKEKAS